MVSLADSTASFRWQCNSTPLSKPETVATLIVCYLVAVLLLRLLVKKPVPVPVGIAALHNAILCFGSLAMFLGTAYEARKVSTGSHLNHFDARVFKQQVLRMCQHLGDQGTCANKHCAGCSCNRLLHLAFLFAKGHSDRGRHSTSEFRNTCL